MIKTEKPPVDHASMIDFLYGPSFSSTTERTGGRLLVVAVVTLVVAIYDVKVKSAPLLPLDLSEQPEVLLSTLALINMALCGSFVLRAGTDLLRVREETAQLSKFIEYDKVRRAERNAMAVDNEIGAMERHDDPFPDQWWEEAIEIREISMNRIHQIENAIGTRRVARLIRLIRVALQTSVPAAVGIAAFAHSWDAALSFLRSVFGF